MALFKISKNKTASVVSTPLQTPRTSLQINASDADKIFHTLAIAAPADVEKILKKSITTIGHNQALSLARV
jgi:hypothetical protein